MRNTCVRTLANFMLVNICGLFPILWMGLGWMPDQVKIYMRGLDELPGPIVSDGIALLGEDYGSWSAGRIFRFYMRDGMEWNGLSFRFPGKSQNMCVDRIVLEKWKLFSFGKSGSELSEKVDTTDEFIFNDPSFDSVGLARGKVTWALSMVELLLFGMSFVAAKRRPEGWKSLWPSVVCVSLVAVALMQVALPIQSYLANRSTYSFPIGSLLMPMSVRFVLIALLSVVSIGILTHYFGRWILGIVLAFSICVYLESGILSNNLASLNGDIWFLRNQSRMLWDALVWCGIFLMVLGGHKILQKYYVLASFCLAVMVVASMVDTKRERVADKSHLVVDGFVPYDTVIQNVAYSTNHNVLVFILDSLEREQAHAILEDSEIGDQLRNSFRGFTEYTNNVGALPDTMFAVPNLLTGHYPDGLEDIADYVWSCYGETSVVRDYLDAGHGVFVTTRALKCGYASQLDETQKRGKQTKSALDITGDGGATWSVRDFSRWRWLPFCTKASCAGLIWIAAGRIGDEHEWGVYPKLSQGKINPLSPGMFLFVHTDGVHVPIYWNRHGEMLAKGDSSEYACIEQGIFIMKTLAGLLDAYRKMDIYDQSTILVLGDHGGHGVQKFIQDSQEGMLPRKARACLWVKPAGSDHDFASCGLPTTHANLSELFKRLVKGPLTEDEIKDCLQSDKRIFRMIGMWGANWTDWVVETNGTFTVLEQEMSLESKKLKRPLACGKHYPLDMKQRLVSIDADFSFRAENGGGGPWLLRNTKRLMMDVLVPNSEKKYVLHLWLNDSKGGTLRFRDGLTDSVGIEVPVEPCKEIVLKGVTASPSGMASVVCERAAGPNVDVAFTALMLEEEK